MKLKGLEARVVQHEIDHLDGVLMTDYDDVILMYTMEDWVTTFSSPLPEQFYKQQGRKTYIRDE